MGKKNTDTRAKDIRRAASVEILAAVRRKGGAHTSPKGKRGYSRRTKHASKRDW